jgi:hypothetical protein
MFVAADQAATDDQLLARRLGAVKQFAEEYVARV